MIIAWKRGNPAFFIIGLKKSPEFWHNIPTLARE